MKKSLLSMAALATLATTVQAESNVNMYGRVDVGYEKWSGSSMKQEGSNMSRFGIKGSEDLGNGMNAFFLLEGSFNADTGSYDRDFFGHDSIVGLEGKFGDISFGKTAGAMEQALGGFNVGQRLVNLDPYASSPPHSNSVFYNYMTGGLRIGGNVTTRGGAGDNVGEGSGKIGYGLHATYHVGNFDIGAAYQADRNSTFAGVDKEYGLGISYKFNPVTVGGTYARSTDGAAVPTKGQVWSVYANANLTMNDSIYAKYQSNKKRLSGVNTMNNDLYGLGYQHSLSKRTTVYAEVTRARDRVADTSATGYTVAMRHAF